MKWACAQECGLESDRMDVSVGRDQIFKQSQPDLVDFVFDESVARVFPDMIRRSVPGYDALIPLIGLLVSRHARPEGVCYDLGCSLGAVTLSIRRQLRDSSIRIIAMDNAEPMIDSLRATLDQAPLYSNIETICADILTYEFEPASVIVLNFVLQFIEPAQRAALINRLSEALIPGGVLILSEKMIAGSDTETDWQIESHLDFKRANHYSELEISGKRAALERTLIPETPHAHTARIEGAGLSPVYQWFQCLNFGSFIAFKPE
jgi:tRNA (cmo5U34)-methyltransferase